MSMSLTKDFTQIYFKDIFKNWILVKLQTQNKQTLNNQT